METFAFLSIFCFSLFRSVPAQQNSSVEGVFAPQRSTHPFRIIENDTMSIQSMTSLGRVGRILAGTIDVTNSIADKDTHSTNASSIDCNVTASTSNTATMSSMSTGVAVAAAAAAGGDAKSSERKAKSTTSCNFNDSSTSSNDNTSNNAMSLQGKQ